MTKHKFKIFELNGVSVCILIQAPDNSFIDKGQSRVLQPQNHFFITQQIIFVAKNIPRTFSVILKFIYSKTP